MDEDSGQAITVGGFDRTGRAWVIALFVLGGIALGILLPAIARWASDFPWVPFQGPLQLLGSFDQPWLVWGRPILGALIALGFALWVIVDSPVLVITPEQIRVQRRGTTERVIARNEVSTIYSRRSKTVIETDTGRILFDDEIEGNRAALRSAFIAHDYPWDGGDD